MPEEFLANLDVSQREQRWRTILQGSPENTLVCEVSRDSGEAFRLVGFGSLLPSRDSDAAPATGEVAALYVDPDAWRCGCGRALCAALLDRARQHRFDQLTLWVLEPNRRARAFYEACGFAPDGCEKIDRRFGDFELLEVRYRLVL